MRLVRRLDRFTFIAVACFVTLPVPRSAAAVDWEKQAAEDARQDRTTVIYDGVTPNKMVCDTTLREMPDGRWVLFFLAGGGTDEKVPHAHYPVGSGVGVIQGDVRRCQRGIRDGGAVLSIAGRHRGQRLRRGGGGEIVRLDRIRWGCGRGRRYQQRSKRCSRRQKGKSENGKG